jgi:hypothetical protein
LNYKEEYVANGHDVGWYQWTPDNAANVAYEDIARGVAAFESLETQAGRAATAWLKDDSLPNHPSTITYLLVLDGRVEGYFALASSSLELTQRHRRQLKPGQKDYLIDPTQGASLVAWIAKHRDAVVSGRRLFLYAISVAKDAAAIQGAVAFVLDPYDQETAERWVERYGFKSSRTPKRTQTQAEETPRLWIPLHSDWS